MKIWQVELEIDDFVETYIDHLKLSLILWTIFEYLQIDNRRTPEQEQPLNPQWIANLDEGIESHHPSCTTFGRKAASEQSLSAAESQRKKQQETFQEEEKEIEECPGKVTY